MARIRSIKPEFWDDEKISNLSLRARLLFIGIWNYCDDVGVCRASPKFLRSKIFPYDDISVAEIGNCIAELVKQSAIIVAEHNEELMLLVKKFNVHQVINKPSKTRLALDTYSENLAHFRDHSRSTPVVVTEDYAKELGARSEELGRELGKDSPPGAKNEKLRAPPAKPTVPTVEKASDAIALYCKLWKERYRTKGHPPIGGKASGQIKKLVSDFGMLKTLVYIEAYFSMPDQMYVMRSHDVGTLVIQLNRIAQFADSGEMISRKEAAQLDDAVAAHNLIKQIREEGV